MAEFIDTKVVVPGTRGHGFLRYYGSIRGKNGAFAGIELIGPTAATRGKNSGDVDGIRYFKVEIPMTGLFLPIERLKAVNPQLASLGSAPSSNRNSISSMPSVATSSANHSIAGSTYSASTSGSVGTAGTAPSKRSSIGSRLSASMKGVLSPSGFANQSMPLPKQRDRRSVSGTRDHSQRDSPLELIELKNIHSRLVLEMQEKTAILNELRATVDEIQPLLQDYEVQLVEKDKKMIKQKADFERAREEWRESIDLMSIAHQENEAYYEKQVELINEKLVELAKDAEEAARSKSVSDEEIAKLMLQIDDLKMEIIMAEKKTSVQLEGKDIEIRILREKLASQETNTPVENSQEKELYENKAKQLEGDIDSMRLENKRSQDQIKELEQQLAENSTKLKAVEAEVSALEAKLNDRETQLADTEAKLAYKEAEVDSIIEKNLVEKVQTVSIDGDDGLQKKVQQLEEQLKHSRELEATVDELKHELSIRPTFNELVDLQTSLDELETLHKKELDSTEQELRRVIAENKDLQKKLEEVLTEQVETAKKELSDRESAQRTASDHEEDEPQGLPIYSPGKVDPSAGKNDWCGLCERDGHSSINCPYENDIF